MDYRIGPNVLAAFAKPAAARDRRTSRGASRAQTIDDPGEEVTDPEINIQSTTLQVNAQCAFNLFCDLWRVPEWVSIIRSVQVLSRDHLGYPTRAAFLADLERGAVGYTLHYQPRPRELTVTWDSDPSSSVIVRGRAHFAPLGERASMLHYELQLDLPAGSLPMWSDPFFEGHAASTVLGDFRDFVHRSVPL